MRWLRHLRRERRDRDLACEIEAYLAQEVDDNLAAGMSRQEAEQAARRKFGNITVVRETVHERNTIAFLETLWQDLRYAARLLRLDPGFFLVATLSLALGVGANTAIFHLLDAVRMRSLPVKAPQELAEVKIVETEHCCNGHFSGRRSNFTYAQWEQIRQRQQAFSGLLAYGNSFLDRGTGGEVQFMEGLWVSGDFFSTLGVTPALGRLLTPEDDRPGCGATGAVVSYSFWHAELGADPQAIGRWLTLDRHRVQVIGVTAPGFFGVDVGHRFDVALPLCAQAVVESEDNHITQRHHWWLAILGRLKPGWTVARAVAHLQSISPGVFEATVPPGYPPDLVSYYHTYQLTALPAPGGASSLRKEYEDPLLLLMAITGLVLLIACANLANLMLARASAREREFAVRLAIGASRVRLVRQLLVESLLIAMSGAALGLVVAQELSGRLLSFLNSPLNPVFVDLHMDWRVFGFTAGMAILTVLLFGLLPAIRATRTAPAAAMKSSGRGLTAGRERFGLRRMLVVSQVALSLVLLVGALLFTRSLRNLLTLDAGFRQDGLLIASLDASHVNAPPARRATLFRDLLDRIRATPGVESAASASMAPLGQNYWNDRIEIPGYSKAAPVVSNFCRVSTGYFRMLGTRLLAGRDFEEHDTLSSPAVAVVNESFRRKFLNGANPIGKRFRIVTGPGSPPRVYEIVGLTSDAKYRRLRDDFSPTAFVAANQDPQPPIELVMLVRSHGALHPLLASLKQTIGGVSPDISILFRSFHDHIQDSLISERLMASLAGFFGFLAAVLATVGLYGVISYMVARRRNEIGLRIALGASRGNILRLVLGEAGMLLSIGLGAGAILAVAAARIAAAMLYGLKPNDPLTIAMAVALLAGVALAASLLPAWRAARVEPTTALREE